MINDSVFLEGSMTKVITLDTIIIGGGMAGLSCALSLYEKGITDIAVLIDSKEGATSKYATCDRQAYYKLAESGSESDSPHRMARTLAYSMGADGDNAYIEAVASSRCFYRLVGMGVPFDQDQYGAYNTRYFLKNSPKRTSYYQGADPNLDGRRMVSAGSDTTGRICAALEREVRQKGIMIFENHQVIKFITDDDKKKVVGALVLNRAGIREKHQRFMLFNAANVVMATGGPGGLFFHESYPRTHSGCLGLALEAGAKAQNLGSFEFGLCSVRRPLMMNGAYQEVIPRFVSTDDTGRDIQEFLLAYFDDPIELYNLQKNKSMEWAFDASKIGNGSNGLDGSDGAYLSRSAGKGSHNGTSLIDLLVYNEIVGKGRHVFMDFRENPSQLEVSNKPYERLMQVSNDAYTALLDHDIDPSEQPVEIYPSCTHHNGGLAVDTYYQSSLQNLYAIGEAAGSQGACAPRGASMNQTQVSSLRCAESIAMGYHMENGQRVRTQRNKPLSLDPFVAYARNAIHEAVVLTDRFLGFMDGTRPFGDVIPANIRAARAMIGKRMDRCCAIYRDVSRMQHELERAQESLKNLDNLFTPQSQSDVAILFQIRDLFIAQICVLESMIGEALNSRGSKGSFIIYDKDGELPTKKLSEMYRFTVEDPIGSVRIQELEYEENQMKCRMILREPREIPQVQ